MVTDHQVRRLFMLIKNEKSLAIAAAKSGMDEETARKYKKACQLPSQLKRVHSWRTRSDPFEDIWEEAVTFLWNPGIEAKTVFEYFQRKYPGTFQDGQLRTFQRKVKRWRALEGSAKEVFFPQIHYPGILSASDFTDMGPLNVTINKKPFEHLFFHFVLTYSNWEDVTLCFSESYESLTEGLQNAFWKLGGVSKRHRTDNLSAAVYSDLFHREFTSRYRNFLDYYGIAGEAINPGNSNENGDAEQSHSRFKKAVNQALLLRGSRDFTDCDEYKYFVQKVVNQLNMGRQSRFEEELVKMRRLPDRRLNDFKKMDLKVGPSSTLNITKNTYSVHSRLIGERVQVKQFSDHIEIWYAQKCVDKFPRLRGKGRHRINYRHIIDWLVRKPGAFENYRYRDDLFPTTRFRVAYDWLKRRSNTGANREYTKLLMLAATETEERVEDALRVLMETGKPINVPAVTDMLNSQNHYPSIREVEISPVDLTDYDELLPVIASRRSGQNELYY